MKFTVNLFAMLLLLIGVSLIKADSPQATVNALASKDLLAVAYVDLKSIEADACLEWAVQQKLVPADVAAEMSHMTGVAQEFLRQATKAGADHVIALVNQEDLSLKRTPPLIVISVAEGQQAEKTIKSLRRILALLQIPDFEMESWNNSILGGTAAQIAKAKTRPSVARPNFANAWKKFGGHDAGAMIFGSNDTRRVLRELLPELDSPFERLSGKMIADNLISGGVSIDLPKELAARIIIQTTDKDSAATVSDALRHLKAMLTETQSEFSAMVPAIGVAAVSAVDPEVVGSDVVVDLGPLLNDKVRLASLLEPVRSGSRRTQRQNNLRQTILAMLNYESAYDSFPASANFDADGKPLLSWRVHILPFLEKNELYQQFKLDEPWNSPHNIKLVQQMPETYADPARSLGHLKQAGKTRVVVPFAEGTMFHGTEGVTFRNITDGSSNTMALVNVVPDKAVVWTQPIDWNVDLSSPKDGLFDEDTKETLFARADGSTDVLSKDILVEQLKGLLTKDGGEVP